MPVLGLAIASSKLELVTTDSLNGDRESEIRF
jgi:hypothetical protein